MDGEESSDITVGFFRSGLERQAGWDSRTAFFRSALVVRNMFENSDFSGNAPISYIYQPAQSATIVAVLAGPLALAAVVHMTEMHGTAASHGRAGSRRRRQPA